uniref:Uncharacterized protein n=1 Tax=Palpitomonas bilix TaxID=652834 RepID=A0A7S3GFA2_9EUKA
MQSDKGWAPRQSFVFTSFSTINKEGTSPNAVPLFAGKRWDVDKHGSARSKTKVWTMDYERVDSAGIPLMDSYPLFLWEELHQQGYVSVYGNIYGGFMGCRFWNNTFDVLLPSIAAFNTPPKYTDTLYKPRVEVGEGACIAGHLVCEYLLQYVKDVFLSDTNVGKDEAPPVGRFLYLPFYEGHRGELASIGQVDEKLASTLIEVMKRDKEGKVSIAILGDHGFKGEDRKHPFLSFILPHSLNERRGEGGERRQNEKEGKEVGREHGGGRRSFDILDINQARLISHFDVYLTLRHILGLKWRRRDIANNGGGGGEEEKWGQDVPSTAVSLLADEVPATRECWEAGVEPGSCVCEKVTSVKVKEGRAAAAVKRVVGDAIVAINTMLESMQARCEVLSLKKVKSVQRVDKAGGPPSTGREEDKSKAQRYPIFVIQFEVENYDSVFELSASGGDCANRWKKSEGEDGKGGGKDAGFALPELLGPFFSTVDGGDVQSELCYRVLSFRQITAYSRFDACSDGRVLSDFCLCQPPSILRR